MSPRSIESTGNTENTENTDERNQGAPKKTVDIWRQCFPGSKSTIRSDTYGTELDGPRHWVMPSERTTIKDDVETSEDLADRAFSSLNSFQSKWEGESDRLMDAGGIGIENYGEAFDRVDKHTKVGEEHRQRWRSRGDVGLMVERFEEERKELREMTDALTDWDRALRNAKDRIEDANQEDLVADVNFDQKAVAGLYLGIFRQNEDLQDTCKLAQQLIQGSNSTYYDLWKVNKSFRDALEKDPELESHLGKLVSETEMIFRTTDFAYQYYKENYQVMSQQPIEPDDCDRIYREHVREHVREYVGKRDYAKGVITESVRRRERNETEPPNKTEWMITALETLAQANARLDKVNHQPLIASVNFHQKAVVGLYLVIFRQDEALKDTCESAQQLIQGSDSTCDDLQKVNTSFRDTLKKDPERLKSHLKKLVSAAESTLKEIMDFMRPHQEEFNAFMKRQNIEPKEYARIYRENVTQRTKAKELIDESVTSERLDLMGITFEKLAMANAKLDKINQQLRKKSSSGQ